MHSHALARAVFVQDALEQPPDSCIRRGAMMGAFSGFQAFALALGLVKRERRDLLQPANLDRAARALVEQLDQLAVIFVNLAPPIFNIHGRASRRLIPRVAACLSRRTRSATAAIAASTDGAFSISATKAEPTTAASARPPRIETWPGSDIPKPTAIGSEVTARARRTSAGKSSGNVSLAPVTPVREMRYRNPVEDSAMRFRRASVEVGAPRNIVSRPRAATVCGYPPASSGVRSVMTTPSPPAVAAVSANRSMPICRTGLK